MSIALTDLIARQTANIAAHEALMIQRKAEAPTAPRAAFAQEKGWRNIAMEGRDTTLRTKPVRQIVLNERDFEAFVWTSAGRLVERFDLRAPDADSRLSRYEVA